MKVRANEAVIAQLPRDVAWRLHDNSPSEVPIDGHPGWLLVTPLGLARAGINEFGSPVSLYFRTKAGELFTLTQQLVLRRDGDDAEIPYEVISDALARLRILARQPLLPRQPIAFTTTGALRFELALPAAE